MSISSLTPSHSDNSPFRLTGNHADGAFSQTRISAAAFESSLSRFAATLAAAQSATVRTLPAASGLSAVTAQLSDGKLVIRGTTGDDQISVLKAGNKIQLGADLFGLANVTRIVVVGDSGNDTIQISAGITKRTLIYGGSGNDDIRGGSGKDEIYGGHGIDVMRGNNGDDAMYGGAGTDDVDGGAGTNTVGQGSSSLTETMSNFEQRVVALTNQRRVAAGLAVLTANSKLAKAAQIHSNNMKTRYQFFIDGGATENEALNESFDHELWGVYQPTVDTRFDYVGYEWSALRENIAYGYTTAAAVVQGWYNSSGHRANMLATDVVSIGVGVSKTADGKWLFTQVFGNTL